MSDTFDYLGHDWEGSLPELPRDLDFFRTSLRLLKELEDEEWTTVPLLARPPWISEFRVPAAVDDDDNVLATIELPGPVDLMIGTRIVDPSDGGLNAQRMTRFSTHLFADYLGDVSQDALSKIFKDTDLDEGRAMISGMIFTARDLILLDFYSSLGVAGIIGTWKRPKGRILPKYLKGVPEIEHRRMYNTLNEIQRQHVMDMFFNALSFYLGYPDHSED